MFVSKRKIRKKISQLEKAKKNDQGILDDLLKGGDIHIDFCKDMTKQDKINIYKMYVDSADYAIIGIKSLLK